MPEPASLLFTGGAIFDGEGWHEEASLALHGDRIAALGSAAALEPWRGPRTRVISLAGRALLPGFHDAHTHLIGGAQASLRLQGLEEVTSDAELCALVAGYVARGERPVGEWISGRGWDADRFPEGAWPERAALDRASPTRPVFLRRRDGHAGIANRRALELAGITRDTPDPPGGRILREPSGEPSGILLEDPAMDLVRDLIPPLDPVCLREAVARALADASRLGITSLQDDPSFDESLDPGALYAELAAQGRLPVRVNVWRKLGRSFASLREEEERLQTLLQAAGVKEQALVRFGLLKGYLDGSLGSRTAHLAAPYTDAPETRGVDLDEEGLLAGRVAAAHAAGYQVGLHAIGDEALRRGLNHFAAAEPSLPALRARRHRVEHAQLFLQEDIARLAALGVVASVQPIHLASDVEIAPARLGAARSRLAYPWGALLRAGARLACGTDFPIEPLGPWPGIACALTRRSRRDPSVSFVPSEAIGLDAALRAYTLGAAEAAHQEDELGRLASGYRADLTLVEADPRHVAPEELGGLRTLLTLRGGEVTFEAALG